MSASTVYSAGTPLVSDAVRAGDAAAVRAALTGIRARTLRQAQAWRAALGTADLAVPYAVERNPPLWELGHIAWFQEWWIARNAERGAGDRADPDAARAPSLLARADAFYDSSRVAHRSRWELPLPAFEATLGYLAQTLAQTLQALDALPPEADADALYFFRLVALHEAMHAEANDYMLQAMDFAGLQPPAPAVTGAGQARLSAQRWSLGAVAAGFAFDNERAAHDVDVPAADIDLEPVSWVRYLPAVEAGAVPVPRYLRRAGDRWQERRGGAWRLLELHTAAVHLSAQEVQAWCRWAGRELPTEAQWECAAHTVPGFRWGHAWEWTASVFEPFPGFRAHPYRDYSQPWFHTRRVLRGACPATDPILAHPRYRNFFEPHRNDVFAGFRTVAPAGMRLAV